MDVCNIKLLYKIAKNIKFKALENFNYKTGNMERGTL